MILYVLEIPPFQKKGPIYPSATQQQDTKTLPDFLTEDKISRNKTYDDHINRGKLLEQNGFPSLAIGEYQQAAQLDPQNPEAFVKIGYVNLVNKNYPAAEEFFNKALVLDPTNLDATIYLGKSYLHERKVQEAKEIFNKINVDSQAVKYYQGIIAAFLDDYENSKELLNKSLKLGTDADLTARAQNFLNAFKEFDFNQGGDKDHLKTLLGRSYVQTGEYQMAIPLLFQVIKEKADYRDAWIILGYAYLNIQQYPDAVQALQKARILDPLDAQTFFYLGIAYDGAGDLQNALLNLQQAKKLGYQPSIQVDQKLAEIYMEMQQYDKAAQSYQNVVSINDKDINYFIRPMWLYIDKLNQPEKALALAIMATKDHPNEAMSYNLLGWAEIFTGNYIDAEKNLQNALALNPNLDAAYLNYGQLFEKKGNFNEALTYYLKAHKLGNGNGISASAAEKYTELLAQVNQLNPNSLKVNLLNPQP